MSRKKSNAKLRASQRLAFLTPRRVDGVWVVPLRWLKNVCGVFLLPVAVVLTQTFFGLFSKAGKGHAFWATEDFALFALGATAWTLWFFVSLWALGVPRPLRAYVFGHELTHAIWVWMWGGRVSQFKVSSDGGYILTDTHNFWIALAPYFYPLYSLVVILAYGIASFFCDVTHVENTFLTLGPIQWLFLLLGFTYAFHLSFTIWMIPKGQTDLTYHGTFFSLVIIYLMNVLLLTVFLVVVARHLSFAEFGWDFFENAQHLAVSAVKWAHQVARMVREARGS